MISKRQRKLWVLEVANSACQSLQAMGEIVSFEIRDEGQPPRPIRVQRRRTKGYRLPPNTIYVGRPSRYGNPFDWRLSSQAKAKEKYRRWLAIGFQSGAITEQQIREDLGGYDLACWCPLPAPGEPDLCHAAVLLEIANPEKP